MGKRARLWGLAGFLWTALAGTGLHFLYGWTGEAAAVAAVAAVNESVWEHMKLLYVPVFLFSMVQLPLMGPREPGFLAARAVSALAGTALIPAAYYTYTGALGVRALWADAALFFLADALVFWLDGRLRRQSRLTAGWQQVLGLAALWAALFAFVWCAFLPPQLPLWQDPVTGSFGRGGAA